MVENPVLNAEQVEKLRLSETTTGERNTAAIANQINENGRVALWPDPITVTPVLTPHTHTYTLKATANKQQCKTRSSASVRSAANAAKLNQAYRNATYPWPGANQGAFVA